MKQTGRGAPPFWATTKPPKPRPTKNGRPLRCRALSANAAPPEPSLEPSKPTIVAPPPLPLAPSKSSSPLGSLKFTGSLCAYKYGCLVSAVSGARVRNWPVSGS